MGYILEVKNLTKEFPGVTALDKVKLQILEGEVHAVVGENGAGKSTLMKILGGQYLPDYGSIYLNGEEIHIAGIESALQFGISVIYQEFNLISELTVAENIYIFRLPVKGKLMQLKKLNEMADALLKRLNMPIKPTALIKDLSVLQQQMVEIAKAISYDSQIIIMDEPTASLTDKEVEYLFEIIGDLKRQGKTILYISHRLKEIFTISDRITVLRDGKYIDTLDTKSTTEDELILKMAGREITNYYHMDDRQKISTEEILRVENLNKAGVFENISFHLNKGEILGFGGLMGSNREAIVQTLFGLEHMDTGRIYKNGIEVRINNPVDAKKNKIIYVTEDRKEAGILPLMGVKENITISVLKRLAHKLGVFLDHAEESKILDYYVDYLDIKCASPRQKVFTLSGGNQQKVLLARSLATDCEILILLEPTRGIDVGAKSEIYNLLKTLSRNGISIIMVTSETNELLTICDRVIVIFQGRISGELNKDEASDAFLSESNLMLCTTGKKTLFCSKGQ